MEELDLDGVPLPKMIWTPVKYKPSQVAQFISLMQNKNYKLLKVAKETGIVYDAAYKFNKQWKENEGTVLPGYKLASEVKTKRNNVKITDERSKFIEDYVEAHPTCIVKDITEQLSANFGDLSVNESTVYRHITKKLEFTLTRTQPRIAARNSEDTKEQRREFVEYLGDNDINFKRKCIFIDESGFKKNMVRPVAWSKKGTSGEVEVQPEGINLSILGCMSVHGLIALSQQVPKPNAVLLNKLGLKNMYIVMDNAAIHKTPDVLREIHEHGHTPLFLPSYSPMLNPIEECWAKIKQEVRKTPLAKSEIIADLSKKQQKKLQKKIVEGGSDIPRSFS
ncbi:hypothetical protein INT45_005444 [Circinella minor]|uniref:Tc1-like transposase DDE domain-containing protein n=1 Tax=Circinella minor TaxID=1195481 RepID=A0A8H7RRL9_9FUNG|nr:hypothetical protein INT45_005444 [Circinella minor]